MKYIVLLYEEKIFCALLYSHISTYCYTKYFVFNITNLEANFPAITVNSVKNLPAFQLLMFQLPAVPVHFSEHTHERVNIMP